MNLKWLVLFLVLLLCGCRNQLTPVNDTGTSVPAIAATEPTDSVGFYAPQSPVEQATGGAVKVFPLDTEDVLGLRFLGERILLFSGHENTTLTLLSGDHRYTKAQLQLDCPVSPDDPSVLVDSRGIIYADQGRRELVSLNAHLEEISRIKLPEDCGTPALSADRRSLYYCTADALRVLDLQTGLSRLLREMTFPVQELTGMHCTGSILECSTVYEDGSRHRLFFAADTGALLYEGAEDLRLWTDGDFYTALCMDGIYPEWLTGSRNDDPQIMVLPEDSSDPMPIPELRSLLTYSCRGSSVLLELYQLESGRKTNRILLPLLQAVRCPRWDPASNTLWFLSDDPEQNRDVLCSWSLDASSVADTESCLQPRWSRENPDMEGLAQCNLLARSIGIKHGVHILIWNDAVACQPWDYTLIAEYQVPLLRRRLEELDTILSCFPAGFLKEAASQTGNGRLSICMVRAITGNSHTGALDSAMGLQFWDADAHAYLAITAGPDMEQHLYHELFHIIDTRILSTGNAYDDWSKLNPKGFSYDPLYTSSRSDEGRSFLNHENRYFVDLYAMSYPKEDRARIMEYAMLEGQADLFRSAPMQAKLRKLCQGIRKAFGLEKESASYLWEQYLETPLAPSA